MRTELYVTACILPVSSHSTRWGREPLTIYQYKTKQDEGSRDTLAFDPITIEGSIYDQIKEAVAKTKEVIERMKRLGDEGLEGITYPDETLHEIITNAVLHRDYSIAADVHVRVYDNRIEIESPGRLPGHITLENILNEQSARNPKIVRLINKFPDPPNKDVGEGLNTAFAAMKRLRLRSIPLFAEPIWGPSWGSAPKMEDYYIAISISYMKINDGGESVSQSPLMYKLFFLREVETYCPCY